MHKYLLNQLWKSWKKNILLWKYAQATAAVTILFFTHYGSLGTVVGTSEPGSGYHFKVKYDVNIDQKILAVIILRSKGKYDLKVVQYWLCMGYGFE